MRVLCLKHENTKTQKHARFHVFSPFSASHYIIMVLPPSPLQYELALGQYPYPTMKDTNIFERLKYVVEGEPPKVPADANFSADFKDFLHQW